MSRSGRPQRSIVERVIFETDVQYTTETGEVLSGRSSDLSVGGIYLKTAYPLATGQIIRLSFSLPSHGRDIDITCDARVAWRNDASRRLKQHYPPGVGLEFLSLPDDLFSKLSALIDTYDENKKMNMICAWCGKHLGMRKGPYGATSHGICGPCRSKIS